MLWIPSKGGLLYEQTLGDLGTLTPGVSVLTGGASSTKTTTPVQILAATAFDSYLLVVHATNYGVSATNSRGCLDIMIGASGSEQVLIADLLMGYSGSIAGANAGPKRWMFPLYIPAGTRLSCRTAGDRVGAASRVSVELYGGNGYPAFSVGTRVVTYGIGTVPAGTTVTPGASGAEGAWTQITASTTARHIAIVPSCQPSGSDTTLTASAITMDVGIGAATEEIIAGGGRQNGFLWALETTELVGGPYNGIPFVMADIPSGTRLAARLSRSSAADTVATWDVALHGVCD